MLKLASILLITATLAATNTTQAAQDETLLGYYNFDNDSADIVHDSSTYTRDGKTTGNVEYTTGINGKAVRFPGINDSFIAIPSTDGHFSTSNALTLSAWVLREDVGTGWDGMICDGSGKGGFQLLFNDKLQNLVLYMKTATTGYQPANGAFIPTNVWTHLAATYDATRETVELYQDGKLTQTIPFKGNIDTFDKQLFIGKSSYAGAFRGIMDEVRIYNKALDAKQIQTLFDEFKDKRGPNADKPHTELFFSSMTAERMADCNGVSVTMTLANSEPLTTADITILRAESNRKDVCPGTKNAKVVFSGEMTSSKGHAFVFFDRIQQPMNGVTLHYWARPTSASEVRISPARVRMYDSQMWWTPNKINDEIERIAHKYPDSAKVVKIANTVQGRPMKALCIGNPDKFIAFVGSTHVSESGPELILPIMESLLETQPELLKKVGVKALPCITLDERQRLLSTGNVFYFRGNANHVDLNRNYDGYWEDPGTSYNKRSLNPKDETYGGEFAFSEPESRAVATMIRSGQAMAAFSMHSVNGLCNAGMLFTTRANDDSKFKEKATALAKIYAEAMYGRENADKYAFYRAECPNGSMASWAYKELGVPGFDLELDNNPDARTPAITDTVSPSLMDKYRKLHLKAVVAVLEHFANQK